MSQELDPDPVGTPLPKESAPVPAPDSTKETPQPGEEPEAIPAGATWEEAPGLVGRGL